MDLESIAKIHFYKLILAPIFSKQAFWLPRNGKIKKKEKEGRKKAPKKGRKERTKKETG